MDSSRSCVAFVRMALSASVRALWTALLTSVFTVADTVADICSLVMLGARGVISMGAGGLLNAVR